MAPVEKKECNRQPKYLPAPGLDDASPPNPCSHEQRRDQAERISPEERRFLDVIRYVKQCPGRPLCSPRRSEIESKQTGDKNSQPKDRLPEGAIATVIPEGLY